MEKRKEKALSPFTPNTFIRKLIHSFFENKSKYKISLALSFSTPNILTSQTDPVPVAKQQKPQILETPRFVDTNTNLTKPARDSRFIDNQTNALRLNRQLQKIIKNQKNTGKKEQIGDNVAKSAFPPQAKLREKKYTVIEACKATVRVCCGVGVGGSQRVREREGERGERVGILQWRT